MTAPDLTALIELLSENRWNRTNTELAQIIEAEYVTPKCREALQLAADQCRGEARWQHERALRNGDARAAYVRDRVLLLEQIFRAWAGPDELVGLSSETKEAGDRD